MPQIIAQAQTQITDCIKNLATARYSKSMTLFHTICSRHIQQLNHMQPAYHTDSRQS